MLKQTTLETKLPSLEEMFEKFKKAVPELIKQDLANGFPVSYRDDQGNLVREYPDGLIEILEKA